MIDKKSIDLTQNYDELEKFTYKVLENMKMDNVPTTPEFYKIYFQKTLIEEKDCEFRKYVSKINIREEKEESEKILEYEEKIDSISKLNKNILKNIQSTYKKNSYLLKFIKESKVQSKSLVTPSAIELFFKKLTSTIEHIHKSLQKDMLTIKELYAKNIVVLKELESNKIFDTNLQVYKKTYFLSKLKKELEISTKLRFKSYLMLIKLDKKTIKNLKIPLNIEKANKFFSKVLQNKFRKNDVIGYLDNGVFGVIFNNLNPKEVQKVAIKFSDILNHSSMYINDEYLELQSVISIVEISGDCYIQNINKALDLIDKAYLENIPYLIDY